MHGHQLPPDDRRDGLRFRDVGDALCNRAFGLTCAALALVGLAAGVGIRVWEHSMDAARGFDPPEIPFRELTEGLRTKGTSFKVVVPPPTDALHPSPRDTVMIACWAEYSGSVKVTNAAGGISTRFLYSLRADREANQEESFQLQMLVPAHMARQTGYSSHGNFASVELASATVPELQLPTTEGVAVPIRAAIPLPRLPFPTNLAVGNFVGTNHALVNPLYLLAGE